MGLRRHVCSTQPGFGPTEDSRVAGEMSLTSGTPKSGRSLELGRERASATAKPGPGGCRCHRLPVATAGLAAEPARVRAGLTSASLVRALGQTIRAERKKLGLSQEALAERAGLNRSYVTDLECGRRTPNLDTLLRVATAFRMKPSRLLSVSETRVIGDG